MTKDDRLFIHPLGKRINYGRTITKNGQDPIAMFLNLYNDYETKFIGKGESELYDSE
jgi:hypothetical protein